MKKLHEFLGSGDRPRLLISTFAVGVMLVVAMLLPLAFRTAPADAAPAAPVEESGDQRQLFADYWRLGAEESGVEVSRPETVPDKTVSACERRMYSLVEQCIDDKKLDYDGPDGSEYTVIRDNKGTEVHLCRMWLESRGDWQNWLDVCFDVDSQEVYYLYLSRECLSNRAQYASGAGLDASYIASTMEERRGWSLRLLEETDDGCTAVFTTDSGTACYQMSCRVYDALVDIKLCCR